MVKKYKITKEEIKTRAGYFFLSLFAFYLVDPAREWITATFNTNPLLIAGGGLILTLYFFDF